MDLFLYTLETQEYDKHRRRRPDHFFATLPFTGTDNNYATYARITAKPTRVL